MVCGFLGTLISLEKAVALQKWWGYAGVLASAAGGIGLVASTHGTLPRALFLLGSLGLVSMSAAVLARHRTDANACVLAGAVSWSLGCALFLLGWPVFAVAPAWMGFLLLTIAGERLELNRLLRPSRSSRAVFFLAVGLALVAIGLAGVGFAREGSVVLFERGGRFSSLVFDRALRLFGLSCTAIGLWLLANDMARIAWRKPGLSRFMAVSLLAGYVWLTLSGVLSMLHGAVVAGETYDAALHSFFLGFVFSMIFAHGPVILPAVLSRTLEFTRGFYVPLALLHAGLVLRILGDLTALSWARPWGGTSQRRRHRAVPAVSRSADGSTGEDGGGEHLHHLSIDPTRVVLVPLGEVKGDELHDTGRGRDAGASFRRQVLGGARDLAILLDEARLAVENSRPVCERRERSMIGFVEIRRTRASLDGIDGRLRVRGLALGPIGGTSFSGRSSRKTLSS
jgi:hypothetical protein